MAVFLAGGCDTYAVEQSDGSYKLYGYKWFSSATDADMTLTLGKIDDYESVLSFCASFHSRFLFTSTCL